ncbi:MAG: M3 family oligoendopeptidase, partial [Ignavibacteria bacterium]
MKFHEIEYKRPDIKELENKFNDFLSIFDSAENFEVQDAVMKDINNLRMELQTLGTIANIKYSIDTFNKSYEEEQNFFDKNYPVYEGLVAKYYNSIINSRFRKKLEEKWGKQLFDFAEQIVKTHRPEILEDLKYENKLKTDYMKLLASAKIIFEDKERNLSDMVPFMESADRHTRKNAAEAKWNFFSENAAEFDRIFDELVKVRHRMAKKLGYENFVEMGYARMGRTDY